MRQSKNLRDFQHIIETYQQLREFAQAFAAGHLNLVILIGPPGIGKSRIWQAAAGPEATIIDGNTTAFGLYMSLYEGRDQVVVIDDVDSLYRDRGAVRLLKSLCQTEPVKTLAWNTDAPTLDKRGIPRRFTTTSRVAIIANRWDRLNIDVAALEDRGHLLHFAPLPIEVHSQAAHWFWDQEIFDFIAAHLHLFQQVSFRHYLSAAELKQAAMDWKAAALARCLTGKLLAVAKYKANETFTTEEQRAAAFVQAGLGCRATYFNLARKLPATVHVPAFRLKMPLPSHPATLEYPRIAPDSERDFGGC